MIVPHDSSYNLAYTSILLSIKFLSVAQCWIFIIVDKLSRFRVTWVIQHHFQQYIFQLYRDGPFYWMEESEVP